MVAAAAIVATLVAYKSPGLDTKSSHIGDCKAKLSRVKTEERE